MHYHLTRSYLDPRDLRRCFMISISGICEYNEDRQDDTKKKNTVRVSES